MSSPRRCAAVHVANWSGSPRIWVEPEGTAMRGSVFKRGRTWTAQVYLGRDAVTGRQRYRQLGGFGTKRAAEPALTAQPERLRVGEDVGAGAPTLAGVRERGLTPVAMRRAAGRGRVR